MTFIHIALKLIEIGEEEKRTLYSQITGKNTLTKMSPTELDAVLVALRRISPKTEPLQTSGHRKLTGRYAKKLQALWIAAWNLGLVQDRNDSALEAFVVRQTGLSAERFLHFPDDAAKVIEALKGWISRETGIEWHKTPLDWLALEGAKIAWAQWRMLHPSADLVDRQGFDEAALGETGRAGLLSAISRRDWIVVMNQFGKRVRNARKAVRT